MLTGPEQVSLAQIVDDVLAARRDRTRSRRAAVARGHRYEVTVAEAFRKSGAMVETAGKAVNWRKDKAADRLVPRTTKHDLFGVWDMVVVMADRRFFVQVTDPTHLAVHRRKIILSGFPATLHDRLIVYVGRGQYRSYVGPEFLSYKEARIKDGRWQ